MAYAPPTKALCRNLRGRRELFDTPPGDQSIGPATDAEPGSLAAPEPAHIAVALGFATRSTAGAVTSVLAIVFMPWILGGVLPSWWQDHVLIYVPGAASEAITSGHLDSATTSLLAPSR